MPATSLVAARLDPEVKKRTQHVLRREHLSDSSFIRRMYVYVAQTGEVPKFLLDVEYDGVRGSVHADKFDELCEWICESSFSSMDFSFLTDESIASTLGNGEDAW